MLAGWPILGLTTEDVGGPHPSLFSSEGWETTKLNRCRVQGLRGDTQKHQPIPARFFPCTKFPYPGHKDVLPKRPRPRAVSAMSPVQYVSYVPGPYPGAHPPLRFERFLAIYRQRNRNKCFIINYLKIRFPWTRLHLTLQKPAIPLQMPNRPRHETDIARPALRNSALTAYA
jgi:hypothetical protein